ncbi:MAG TPA: hypothetical protein VFW88_06845 [Burkholderiales bacterium]|nr:hypothetical protein [Burkholderiales bacterium]
MKTAVRETSITAYYERIVAPGVELSQTERIIAYVVTHPCCTRRQIAAHFAALNPHDPLAQEARVSARVNAALKQRLITESAAPVSDSATGQRAHPLYPVSQQADLFFARSSLHSSGNHPEA